MGGGTNFTKLLAETSEVASSAKKLSHSTLTKADDYDISVVIPVYNSEKYLPALLDSLVNQENLNDLRVEYLLIDNLSTDSSPKIMKDYVKKRNNFKLFSCKTPGAAAARNYGIRKCRGKYFWCVDSDDLVEQDAIRKMYDTAEKSKTDIVLISVKQVFLNGKSRILKAPSPKIDDNFKDRFIMYGFGPWQMFIRRSFWNRERLSFHEGIIHEDLGLLPSLVLYTDKIIGLPDVCYQYIARPTSVVNNQTPMQPDIFIALNDLYLSFLVRGAVDEYRVALEYFFIWNLLSDYARTIVSHGGSGADFKRARLFLRAYFPYWHLNPYLLTTPLKRQLSMRLNYWGITMAK